MHCIVGKAADGQLQRTVLLENTFKLNIKIFFYRQPRSHTGRDMNLTLT